MASKIGNIAKKCKSKEITMSTAFFYANDPFFEGLDVKNLLRQHAQFQPFASAKVDYPLDSWFNDEYLVFELPILKAKSEDIDITKTVDRLRIKYTRSNKEDDGKKTYVKKGLTLKDFDLTWKIDSRFDAAGIQSVFEGGLLTIYIPFAKKAEPEKVPILDTNKNWKKLATEGSLDKKVPEPTAFKEPSVEYRQ